MDITAEAWQAFLQRLRTVNNAARDKILVYLRDHPVRTIEDRQTLIEYAYLICSKYGEGAAASFPHLVTHPVGPAGTWCLSA